MKNRISTITSIITMGLSLMMLTNLWAEYITTTQSQNLTSSHQKLKTEEWIDVFIHGTFNCHLAIFSLPSVLRDNVNKTLYKTMAIAKRKETTFFLDQPMLQKGLINVNPHYQKTSIDNNYVAYPLLKAYTDISRHSIAHPLMHHTYTFGWSGLLSQKQRRKEAVRLYNMLVEEIERLKLIGHNPKIRLIAHSHGGNLCLNLAAINEILSATKLSPLESSSQNTKNNGIVQMFSYLKQLPNRDEAKSFKKFKKYDHIPSSIIAVDELIMLGTPIQIETINLITSPTFSHVYSFYSDHDSIQKLDFISTQEKSLKRITLPKQNLLFVRPIPEIYQGRLIINYHKKKRTRSYDTQYRIGHKELWGISWRNTHNPLHPLPISVLSPLLIAAIKDQENTSTDLDINLKVTKKHFKIQVSPFYEQNLKTTKHLSKEIFKEVQNALKPWNPYRKYKA